MSQDNLVEFRGVQKSYDGKTLVVRALDLDIRRGEFLTLLGPSGSGKTTCLMMLAGFESPTSGEIVLDGQPITRTPPHRRNFGMVFQNYALFPHMTVGQNVAYPLTVRRQPKAEVERKVARALDMVQLDGKADRFEPLGALDKQLREHMQIELKELHRQLGVTFVYVTHDQGEALTMSDRVAVFNDGEIQQIDAVERLYETPANRFVAGFVGDSTVFSGTMGAVTGAGAELVLPGGERLSGINVNAAAPGAEVVASVRPERIEACFTRPDNLANVLQAAVSDVIYFGDHLRLRCAVAGQGQATAKLPLARGEQPAPGQPVWLHVPTPYLRLYA